MSSQTNYVSSLTADLTTTATTMAVKVAPVPTTGRICLVNGNVVEWVQYTGVSGTTLTGLTRSLSTTANPATSTGPGLYWGAGTRVFMTKMHDQLVDTVDSNTFSGNNTFSGTNTFTGAVDMSNISDLNVNGKSNPAPVVADTTARDVLYPSPVEGDEVNITGVGKQRYNGSTAQWETFDIGTPPPTASTSVQGIMKLHAASADPKAIVSEEAGTSGTAVSASNKLVDNADTTGTGLIIRSSVEASTTVKGIVELATDAEVTTGTDTSRVTTPAQLHTRLKRIYVDVVPAGTSISALQTLYTQTIDANTFTANSVMVCHCTLRYGNASSGTGTVYFKFGGVTIYTGAFGLTGGANTPAEVELKFSFDATTGVCNLVARTYSVSTVSTSLTFNVSTASLTSNQTFTLDAERTGSGGAFEYFTSSMYKI